MTRSSRSAAAAAVAFALLLPLAASAAKEDGTCSSAPALVGPSNYSAVFSSSAAFSSVLRGVASRSTSQRDHAVSDGSSRSWARMPGWDNTKLTYLIQPSKGSNFVMYLADMGAEAVAIQKSPIIERFWLVLDGQVEIEVNGEEVEVPANHYAYQPPASEEFLSQEVTSKKGAKALIFERIFGKAEGMPLFKTGGVDDAAPAPAAPGGAAVQRSLVPDSDEWDFDVMVIDVLPGQAAPSVRAHYAQHGMFLLSGEGILKLGDNWYPVRAGDGAWAAPYVPQWFAALGGEPARMVLYTDRYTDPLLTV